MKNCSWLQRVKKEFNRENYKLLLKCAVAAFIITIITEILARRSIDDTLSFMIGKLPAFLFNAFLVFVSLNFALLFRRRSFSLFLAGGIWVGVAIADCILLSVRSMPLTAPDIWLMGSVRSIFDKYLSYVELGGLMLLIAMAIAGIIYILYRARKHNVIFTFALSHLALGVLVLAVTLPLLTSVGAIQETTKFHNLPRAYENNGFCYCFAASLVTGGVEEPDDYSREIVDQIKEEIELPQTASDTPNIVFVQLESFFDPNYMDDVTYEENPVPNFQALRAQYPSGLLSVPCIGAGTANTEFEVLTGMNLSHFGVGEYPYMTIVDSACPQTIAYCLKNIGYATHAIHNNNATFYDRDIVYANLSFETFTTLEYMDLDPETDFTPTQWAKDSYLTDEIVKCLDATDGNDFVFTVSVQPHGRYPSEYTDGYDYLHCEGIGDEERRIGFEYYLHQLKQTDLFVGELVEALSAYDEKTVVVFYGDHLPSFNIQPEELNYGDEQTTEYIIWANYDIGNDKRDLQTYQLSAYAMSMCGIYEGDIFKLHQSNDYPNDDNEEFQQKLNNLEYDMLEGEHFADGSVIRPTDLRFDVEDIVIKSVTKREDGDGYDIIGENFTRYSMLYYDEEIYSVEFVSENHLIVRELSFGDGASIVIAQISAVDEMDILSKTEPYIMEAQDG